MKGKYIRIALLLVACLITGTSFAAETADQVLKKSAAKINAANGLTADFTLDSGGKKVTGILKSAGKKFAIETPVSSTWYDGKTMWTYNSSTGETTVMTPTAQEVSESNPLTLVHTYGSLFTASFAKTQKKGSKTIVLTPKSKKTGYKSVHVTITESNGIPSRIVIVPQSGQKLTVSIGKTQMPQKFSASTFSYPKTKYPKAEIVDLR